MAVDIRAREPVSLESTSPSVDVLIEEAKRHARRRRAFTAAIAAAVAVAGAAAVAAARNGDQQPDGPKTALDSPPTVAASPPCVPAGEVPPVPDSRWVEEAFVSSAPISAPAAGGAFCELVLRYGFHRLGAGNGFGPSPGLSGMVFLYSDGRLIVDTATEQDWFVQWERRLTLAGVEHLRSAVVANLDESGSVTGGPAESGIHYGDDIVYPKDPQALVRLLIHRSWLPEESWIAETATVYRAAWYLACYETPASGGVDVQTAIRGLPFGAHAVLESREWTGLPPDDDEGVVRPQCVVLSRADATALVQALGGDISVGKANVFPGGLPGPAEPFSVYALMPDGTSGAHGD